MLVSELPVQIQTSQDTISAQQVNQYNPCQSVKSIFIIKEEQSLKVPFVVKDSFTISSLLWYYVFWALHPFLPENYQWK